MIKGFSILEVLVAMSIGLMILTFVVLNMGETVGYSRKIIGNQQKLEAIFSTASMIRSDLLKCGMRLSDGVGSFHFPLFENNEFSFKVVYGIDNETIHRYSPPGARSLSVNRNGYFQRGRRVLVYDPGEGHYEITEVERFSDNQLHLRSALANDYPPNALVVVLKEVEYKLYQDRRVLKRKVNKGYFQPVVEDVTDFFVQFFPGSSSVLYRIEVARKEQISGYIYMSHMVKR